MSTKTKTKRVHILSSVNAANVSKTSNTYLIKDVCGKRSVNRTLAVVPAY